ncbi:uncharacterized protein LOC102473879 isoform X2 [Tupaia chinensis]|uniref:uncharacterized protein LOC102473879 isoform X2 n=1 Tax=Tupaia chinensis TaxID=246437 RepID=UPI000FFC06DE|nr:uncharacterized protein LOC102473879 isoform X2 [Tupaia chinensis]
MEMQEAVRARDRDTAETKTESNPSFCDGRETLEGKGRCSRPVFGWDLTLEGAVTLVRQCSSPESNLGREESVEAVGHQHSGSWMNPRNCGTLGQPVTTFLASVEETSRP